MFLTSPSWLASLPGQTLSAHQASVSPSAGLTYPLSLETPYLERSQNPRRRALAPLPRTLPTGCHHPRLGWQKLAKATATNSGDTEPTARVSKTVFFAALSTLSLAALMQEILLTRIFSVVTWYHFAFLAVSVAMFGITLGAVTVYLFRSRFSGERVSLQLCRNCICFSLSTILSCLAQIYLPFGALNSWSGIFWTFVVCLALLHNSGRVTDRSQSCLNAIEFALTQACPDLAYDSAPHI